MPGPFIEEVPIDEDHTKGTYMKAGHEEDILETFPEVKEGDEVQPQTKDVGKELPSTPVVTRIDAFKSPLRGSPILLASAAPMSTPSLQSLFLTEVYQGYSDRSASHPLIS